MSERLVPPKQPSATSPTDEAAFETDVKEWLAHAGRSTDAELEAIRAKVAALPGPETGRRRRLLGAAASIVVLLGLGGLVIGRLPAVGLGAQPPDPAAYAGDPRLEACSDRIGVVAQAFEMTHARWFPLYFPGWAAGAPELEVDEPALVVLGPEEPVVTFGGRPVPGQTFDANIRLGYKMCIAVGPRTDALIHEYGPTRFERIVPVLSDAEIARVARIDGPTPSPPPPTPAPTTSPTVTPKPEPDWSEDAEAALSCTGAPSSFGRDHPPGADVADASSPDDALKLYIEAINFFDYPLPIAGYEETGRVDGARLYTADIRGGVKAAVVVASRPSVAGERWLPASVASCDETEYDPTTLTARHVIGIWADARGDAVPSSTLGGMADCYGGTQVRFRSRLYVRIPYGGVDPSQLASTWAADVALPPDAVRTGFRSGDLDLFVARDGRSIFVAKNGRAERLPHVIGDVVERTDCN